MTECCDILLQGGLVIDGTGAAEQFADVAIQGDRIAAVGELGAWRARTRLKVRGLVVTPGFIDMHSHSDLSLLINPKAESKLRQGVTTEVIGQCGFSPAPAPEAQRAEVRAAFASWGEEVNWTWGRFRDYLDALRLNPTSVNVAPVVGHGTIRTAVMGESDRTPTTDELAHMRAMTQEALNDGAIGLSTGLVYAPGMFATTDEIVALAQLVAWAGGVYFSHIRGEADGLLHSIEEAIAIGRQAGLPVQISHLKAEGRRNWGKSEAALIEIDRARQEGMGVTFDVYPYTAWNTGLPQLLPAWAREGGIREMLDRLRDPVTREKLHRELAAAAASDPGRWERRMIASVESKANRRLQGMTLAEIAERRGVCPEKVALDLLLEEQGRVSMVGFGMDEKDLERIITHPAGMIGSDAAAVAPYGTLGEGHPHPRAYGAFPRVLGHYVRERGLLSMVKAIEMMTGKPAAKLGLRDRGMLAPGMAADVVVFDQDMVADLATYQDPHQYPTGIHYVIVNGVVELEGEKHLDRRPGRVLARIGTTPQNLP